VAIQGPPAQTYDPLDRNVASLDRRGDDEPGWMEEGHKSRPERKYKPLLGVTARREPSPFVGVVAIELVVWGQRDPHIRQPVQRLLATLVLVDRDRAICGPDEGYVVAGSEPHLVRECLWAGAQRGCSPIWKRA
jgi:hypothetical protein